MEFKYENQGTDVQMAWIANGIVKIGFEIVWPNLDNPKLTGIIRKLEKSGNTTLVYLEGIEGPYIGTDCYKIVRNKITKKSSI